MKAILDLCRERKAAVIIAAIAAAVLVILFAEPDITLAILDALTGS